MRVRGQITVFLSLVLVCICALMLGILESARTAGARCYLQAAVDSAMDSLLSQYHRRLWNQYRILGLEFEDEADIGRRFKSWLEPYTSARLFYPTEIEDIRVQGLKRLTDGRGREFEKEVLSYMKYGIWKTDLTEDTAGEAFQKFREARAVSQLSQAYSGHQKEAVRLENAIERIADSQDKQAELYRRAKAELDSQNGPGFRELADDLLTELKRMPGLVGDYEKKADALGKNLAASRQEFLESQEELSDSVKSALDREIAQYEAYTAKDGERRKEIVNQKEIAARNSALVEETIQEALDVEEIIDEWEESEGDEEEDELDTDALWEPVRAHFSRFEGTRLSFKAGIQDKEKQGVLEQIGKMAQLDLLTLVMPEGEEVSAGVPDQTELPSQAQEDLGGESISDQIQGRAKGILVNEYCGQFLSDFLTQEKKEVQYEIEYVIAGQHTDEENLKEVVKQLLELRGGLNLCFLLSDTSKRNEANALAAAIVGATGLAPLVAITAFFIMCIWALGEAISDVKALLYGWNVPLIKTEATWKLSLEGLLTAGRQGSFGAGENGGEGMNYASYLKLLLFMMDPAEKNYRIMDVIQMNIRRDQDDFRMVHCGTEVDICAQVCGKHVFFASGMWRSLFGGVETVYRTNLSTIKSY